MLKARLIGKFDVQYGGQPVIVASRAAQLLDIRDFLFRD